MTLRCTASEVDLVVYRDPRQGRGQASEDFAFGVTYPGTCIDEQNDQIRAFDFALGARDPYLLDFVISLAQAGGIDDV